MKRYWITANLAYLLIVGALGVLMRGAFTGFSTGFNYEYALHTHSHTAFIGWVYQALFVALASAYLSPEQIARGRYRLQLILTQILVLGMLVSFWRQGYSNISIVLSSIFQFVSYWFIWQLWRDGRRHRHTHHNFSWQWIEISLVALFISTLGPWGLATITYNGLQGTPNYNMAIYFYLHFQYNGWFIFALAGLALFAMESDGNPVTNRLIKQGFYLVAISLFPAYALSIVNLSPSALMITMAVLSGTGQVIGVLLLAWGCWQERMRLKAIYTTRAVQILAVFSGVALLGKFVLQLLSMVPGLDDIAFNNRHVIIAFIHWVVLGVVTFGLLAMLAQQRLLRLRGWVGQLGVAILMTGFIITEWYLVSPAIGITSVYMFTALFYAGLGMAAGIALIMAAQLLPLKP